MREFSGRSAAPLRRLRTYAHTSKLTTVSLRHTRSRRSSRITGFVRVGVIATAAIVILTQATPAQACGGLFCNTPPPCTDLFCDDMPKPPRQTDERILFIDHGDGMVTAVVEVSFAGDPHDFAWVVPVRGIPEVDVTSSIVFDRLDYQTRPRFTLTSSTNGMCEGDGEAISDQLSTSDGGPATTVSTGGHVRELAAETVGPYEYQVIEIEPGHEEPLDVAAEWLEAHGYDVDGRGRALLRPYLEQGLNLLAFRLSSGAETGDIQPIMMTYEEDQPCVPIRLTAVATEPHLGVEVWVLAEARAVPMNYLSLTPNMALIDWFNTGRNYREVVQWAADEAGGHGFVTEYADSSQSVSSAVWSDRDVDWWAAVQAGGFEGRNELLLEETITRFGREFAFVQIALDYLEDLTTSDYDAIVACPSCAFPTGSAQGLDVAGFVAAVDASFVAPLSAIRPLLESQPYITRLFTTLSADEMTLDPWFDYNSELATVDNHHRAHRRIYCGSDEEENGWEVVLPNGSVVEGIGEVWPFVIGVVPANQAVDELGTEGPGRRVSDNTETINAMIAQHNSGVSFDRDDALGCQVVSGSQPSAGLLALCFGALVVLRRRRQTDGGTVG